jgi:hypothetical protein
MENKNNSAALALLDQHLRNIFPKKLRRFQMKTARMIIAVAMVLFLQTALTPYVFAQMGGGDGMMGPGYGGQGMGGGMMGGQGYGPGYGGNQGYGPGPGYRPSPEQSQPPQNLTPEEQKARAKAFVDEYIQRYLPDYELEKKDSKKTE